MVNTKKKSYLSRKKKVSRKKNNNNSKKSKKIYNSLYGGSVGSVSSSDEPVVINKDITLKQIQTKYKSKYIQIKDDGWCFYYAILRGLKANPETAIDDRDEAIDLAKQISEWLKVDTNLSFIDNDSTPINLSESFENILKNDKPLLKLKSKVSKTLSEDEKSKEDEKNADAVKTLDDYINYTVETQTSITDNNKEGFNNPGPLLWPIAEISGHAVANILNINLKIYSYNQFGDSPYISEYKVSVNPKSDQPKDITLLYYPEHYDLLIPIKDTGSEGLGLGSEGLGLGSEGLGLGSEKETGSETGSEKEGSEGLKVPEVDVEEEEGSKVPEVEEEGSTTTKESIQKQTHIYCYY